MNALNSASIGVYHIYISKAKIFINESFASILGYTSDDLNPIPIESWFEIYSKHDHQFLKQLIEQFTEESKTGFSRNCRLKHKNGTWLDVQMNGKVTHYNDLGNPEQITGTIFDISELSTSKNNLNYRYQIEKLVSGISSDFVEVKLHSLDKTINLALKKIGDFCQIDRSYLFLLHWDKQKFDNTHEWCAKGIKPEIENLQNMPCSLFPWWMRQLWAKKYIYIYDVDDMPEEAAAEKEILQAQGIKSLLVVPIVTKGDLIGFMGFDSVENHKDWHRSDIELLETVGATIGNALAAKRDHELLLVAKEKAEESNRLKSAFMATMNHELRTPLHHILGFSDLIKSGAISQDQNELYASKIYDSGRNLLQIVEDVLSLAIGNKEDVKVRQEAIRGLDLFVQHKSYMIEILATLNREKDIQLQCHPDPEFMTQSIVTDKNKINQILINLFRNAVKFTQKGIIEYGLSLKDGQLILSVKDDGIGVPRAQRDLIFEFFRQGEDTTTRRFHGIGIGLAICKNLVQIMGGQIELKSLKGNGSTFTVTIPVEVETVRHPKINATYLSPIPNYSNYRFLLVDDDPNSSFLIKNLLVKTNANVLTTGNDLEALAYMGDSCFLNVILFNIKAYTDTSLKMIKEMTQRCCRCAIIGLVSHSFLSEKEKALKAGCVEVLSKPIDTQLLFEAINKAIRSKGNGSGSCSNKTTA
ncbi:PAS domain S-box-containing protein [Mangrovibacterium diazotrophicum]|uniref:histidine kinase n=2 Tax=Mangrovibacterium diazotrophicum TaxID=1261403 RepID=A0A419VW07_9BACT|nr:PAS domain S-box-containing protein [Mangrovibacterium diazotrophicum]